MIGCKHEIVDHGFRVGDKGPFFTRTGTIELAELLKELNGKWLGAVYTIGIRCNMCGYNSIENITKGEKWEPKYV